MIALEGGSAHGNYLDNLGYYRSICSAIFCFLN